MIFSVTYRKLFTAIYYRKLKNLRRQDERRSPEAIELLTQQAKTALINMLRSGEEAQTREAEEKAIEDARIGAHRFSASVISTDFQLQEKHFASLDEVNNLEQEAYRHLDAIGHDELSKKKLIKEAAERTRRRVEAEQICAELASPKEPLKWDDFQAKKGKFIRRCASAGLSLEVGSKYQLKFAENAELAHRFSIKKFWEVLFYEGKSKYHDYIDKIVDDMKAHFHALVTAGLEPGYQIEDFDALAKEARKGNTAGYSPSYKRAQSAEREAAARMEPEPGGGLEGLTL